MKKLTSLIIGLAIGCGFLFTAYALIPETHNTEQNYNWAGKWKYESPSGKLLFIVHIKKTGSQNYVGWHSMVDGRIHGGAMDSYSTDENGDIIPSLTNSNLINPNLLEFDFKSGYISSSGKAQFEVVDINHVLFRVTDPPTDFGLSPLGNLVYQFNGYDSDTGGVTLTRQ